MMMSLFVSIFTIFEELVTNAAHFMGFILEAVRDARATTAKHFEEEYKKLTAANQKLEQQLKAKSEEKSEGFISAFSQVMKRGSSSSPSTQDAKGESNANDELSDTMKQVCCSAFLWSIKPFLVIYCNILLS